MRWKPNVTVAAIVELQGRFLLVEEQTDQGLRLNQPAGHLDDGESLLNACIREAAEETGFQIRPTALVGIYQWSPPGQTGLTYLRFAFAAELLGAEGDPTRDRVNLAFAGQYPHALLCHLDDGIVRAIWMSREELLTCQAAHRSPLTLQCVDDYLAGRRFPIDLIHHYD
ncbi:NUDIX hydrolase [Parachitinimonas caeni]|uniref:Phosphatase NudJ n=1 Tax=Parachitinimonas caeni TaxID=3031301 RepID=A0ABT7DVC4_9NEIS|nr:NUDIX hydrolase [Parachitinimonas caeni]MDK2124020.1 NUDIX hydrolase [Parachitinimonas caeni]